MYGHKKANLLPAFFLPLITIGILLISTLACSITGTATEEVIAISTQVIETAHGNEMLPTQVFEQPETVAPTTDLGVEIIGFWKTKVIGKQVMIFEFQRGGQMVWYYRYNNGQKNDRSGTYRVQDSKVIVDLGEPQELAVQLDGTNLTLIGPDGESLDFQRVASLDDPTPSASKNIAQDIINRWQDIAAQEWIEFKADGTVTIQSNGNDISGTYSVNDDKLEMRLNDQEMTSSFMVEIDSNVLTLYTENGSFIDYVK